MTGESHIQANKAGGGGDNLGNHIATQDLEMRGFDILLGIAGGAVRLIKTVNGSGANNGVELEIRSGNAPQGGSNFVGPKLRIQPGLGGNNSAGGKLELVSGGHDPGGTGVTGDVLIQSENSTVFRTGEVDITTGTVTGASQRSGHLNINTGNGVNGAGEIFIQPGASTGTGNFSGASIHLFAAAGGGTFSGQGGDIHIRTGARATVANADPGMVDLDGMVGFEANSLGTLSSNTTIEPNDGTYFDCTIQAAASVQFSLGRVRNEKYIEVVLEIVDGGGGTVTWAANVQWAGGTAPTLTGSGTDIVRLFTRDNGTTWYGETIGLNFS